MTECASEDCTRDLDEAGRSTDDPDVCTFCAVIQALQGDGE